jgi:hypothetical protein
MGLIKKKHLFLFFLLQTPFANSVLLDPQFGKVAPDVISPVIDNCSGAGAMLVSECKDEMTTQINDQMANYGDGTTSRMTSRGEISFSQSETNLNASKPTWIEYLYSNPERWVKYSQSAISKNATIRQEAVPQCPDPNNPDYKVPRYIDINGNNVLYCFEQTDLNFRDSCPDSTQDGAYVIPVSGSNTSDSMCVDKPDGSSCKYKKTGESYTTDFENDCYILNGLDRWQEDTALTSPDPTNPDCQDIGNAVTACIENPDNVCDSSGACNEGCGNVAIGDNDPVFVCLSGDTDNDGLADYLDPDIDGDGIANDLDLDSDGDGKDDPKYPTSKSSEGTVVNVDTSQLETLAGQGNAALESIKDELETQNGSGLMPAYSVVKDQEILNNSTYGKIANSDLVLAFSGVATFINFGGDGACPDFSFYLPSPIDKQVGTDLHCTLMPSISVILSPVMIAIYIFLGFRVFTSA